MRRFGRSLQILYPIIYTFRAICQLKVRFRFSFVSKIYRTRLLFSRHCTSMQHNHSIYRLSFITQNIAEILSPVIQNPTSDRREISQVPSLHLSLGCTGTLLKSKPFSGGEGETRYANTAFELFSSRIMLVTFVDMELEALHFYEACIYVSHSQ
jgi:hypothetical protein